VSNLVFQCPQCGSPAVEFSELVGGEATCNACTWVGKKEDLLGTPFDHILGTREGIGFELFNDTRRLLSSPVFIGELGGFLSRWGFIDLEEEKSVVVKKTTRYVAAIARAVLTAVIQEREKIEKERYERERGGDTPEAG
jgi:hypothetical protein